MMITRLQLGASRLENLDPKVLRIFVDKTWIHFGDPKPIHEDKFSHFLKRLKKHSFSYNVSTVFGKLQQELKNSRLSEAEISEIYNRTNFLEFYYQKGNRLPFDDNSINFIFSEHFFEHLFFDEALSLFRECHRILKPYGVIRTCVPDADLRTYESPEPLGFPDIKLSFADPAKHKMRWSVYSLAETIKTAGFYSIPLRYCTKKGEFIKVEPSNIVNEYEKCPEQEFLFDLTYIFRVDRSLVVDGIKKKPQI
jgi:predicted SAM-dependent methyltransferase